MAEESKIVLGITLPSSLAEYDCHFRWAAKPKEKPFTEQEAEKILIETSTLNMENMTKEITLKHIAMNIIGNKATRAFCSIVVKAGKDGKLLIDEMSELIKTCLQKQHFPKEYAEGLEYVLRGLEMFFLCQQIENGCEDAKDKLKMMIQSSVAFETLGVKGQVAVRFMELCFGRNRRLKDLESVEMLRDIIRHDGDHFRGYYYLHCLLRVRRRDRRFPGDHVGPDEEEKAMIIKAAELAPDNPFVIISFCRCLLEIFNASKQFGTGPFYNPIRMGEVGTFTTGHQIAQYIRQMSQKPIEDLEDSKYVNLNLAEFFSSSLPYHLRDNALAKQCLQKALDEDTKLDTNSSKTNHRMAAFYLTAERNPKEAMKYFKIAVASCPTNFPALSDMIMTMMGNIQKFDGELNSLFQENLENPRWGNDKQGNLYFLFGMFMFIKKDADSAVQNWIKSYSKNSQSVGLLKSVPYHYNRYGWQRQDISIEGVHSVLKTALADIARSQEEIATIKKILEVIDGFIVEDNDRTRGRGIDRGGQIVSRGCHRGNGRSDNRGLKDSNVSDVRSACGGSDADIRGSRGNNDFRGRGYYDANRGNIISVNRRQDDSDVQNWRSQCGSSGNSCSNDNRGRGGNGTECRQQ